MRAKLVDKPSEGRLRLGFGIGGEEGFDRIARIAYPGVAIIPVFGPPDTFGERGGGSGGDGARWGIEQQLQRQRAAQECVPIPAIIGNGAAPVAPFLIGDVDTRIDLLDAGGHKWLIGARHDGDGPPVASADRDRAGNAFVRPFAGNVIALDEEAQHPVDMEDRVLPDLGMIGVNGIAAPPWPHHQSERDAAVQPIDAPRQFSPREATGMAAIEGFGEFRAPMLGLEDRFEDIAVIAIPPLDGVGLVRLDAEDAAILTVEQSIEQRRRVHIRHAPPVDGSVYAGQRNGAAVAQRSILFEWQIAVGTLAQWSGFAGGRTQIVE